MQMKGVKIDTCPDKEGNNLSAKNTMINSFTTQNDLKENSPLKKQIFRSKSTDQVHPSMKNRFQLCHTHNVNSRYYFIE